MPANTVSVAKPSRWSPMYPWWVCTGQSSGGCRHTEAVQIYREDIMRRPRLIEAARQELRGKNLACWCPLHKACHADVLIDLANLPTRLGRCSTVR